MKRARGPNARAWFDGRSFNARSRELEKDARLNFDFYSGSSEEVFKEMDAPQPDPKLTATLEASIDSIAEQKRCEDIGREVLKNAEAPELAGPRASINSQPIVSVGDQHTMNRTLLEKPFAPEEISRREYDGLDYIEAPLIIQRLNEAFNAEWAFEIQEHTILENEVIVLGKLTAQGVAKTQFGAKQITRRKDDKKEVSLGDDLKAAATDSLKKCATLFGVALHLYLDEPAHETTVAAAPKPPTHGNGDGRVTARQLSAIFGIGKEKGWSNKDTREFAKSMFGKLPDFLTMREASAMIDHLKAGSHAN
jgi:hypothetical protein